MNNFTLDESPTFNLYVHYSEEFEQNEVLTITVFINIESRLRLRNLEGIESNAKCNINKKDLSTGNIKFVYKTNSNRDLCSLKGLNIFSDNISGIPENADTAKTDIEIKRGLVPIII